MSQTAINGATLIRKNTRAGISVYMNLNQDVPNNEKYLVVHNDIAIGSYAQRNEAMNKYKEIVRNL